MTGGILRMESRYPEYAGMNKETLKAKLEQLREALADAEETLEFNLTNTSAHLSSGAVSEHEDELGDLRDRIAAVKKLMAEARE